MSLIMQVLRWRSSCGARLAAPSTWTMKPLVRWTPQLQPSCAKRCHAGCNTSPAPHRQQEQQPAAMIRMLSQVQQQAMLQPAGRHLRKSAWWQPLWHKAYKQPVPCIFP